jgi:hypothetical protein
MNDRVVIPQPVIDAAAEVLCDATGWRLVDCRHIARLMIEEALRVEQKEKANGRNRPG